MFSFREALFASILAAVSFYPIKAYSRTPRPVEISASQIYNSIILTHCLYTPTLFGRRMFNEEHNDDPTLSLARTFSDLRNQNFNDRAGSICVPAGWEVTVYGKKDFDTPLATFTGPPSANVLDPIDVRGLTSGLDPMANFWNFGEGSNADMNDVISSVRVRRVQRIGSSLFEICASSCPPFIRLLPTGVFEIVE
jgi:hypothetical protein